MTHKSKNNQIPQDSIDLLAKRIEECESVVRHLDECPAWKVIEKDLKMCKQEIDDHWQDITDDIKLGKAREIKYAYLHLLNLKNKYQEDLNHSKQQMDAYQNPKTKILKDYDGGE